MNSNIEKILNSCGVSLYDTQSVIENDRKIYRVFITSKDGITLEKCEEVSKILSPIFDLEPPVGGMYYLEVSSPGIERLLKRPSHFTSSIGELVKIKLENGDKFKGKIVDANEDEVSIEDDTIHKIKYDQIEKAKTYFEW